MTSCSLEMQANRRRMEAGELYHAFTPDLVADRRRAQAACERLNGAGERSRRELALMVKE